MKHIGEIAGEIMDGLDAWFDYEREEDVDLFEKVCACGCGGVPKTATFLRGHNKRQWSDADDATMRGWYTSREGVRLDLDGLAKLLGRTKALVCRQARAAGLSNKSRPTGRKARRKKHATDAERRAAISKSTKERHARDGHPRGMLGKKHTVETRAKISAQHKNIAALGMNWGQLNPPTQKRRDAQSRAAVARLKTASNPYSRCRDGRREDLDNRYFRSRWEANYARFLNFLQARGTIERWEYESETFWFEKIRRGVRSYTPDFKVFPTKGKPYFVEVKGWMDAKSKTKIKRMKKYYPEIELQVVEQKAYMEIANKMGGAIPGWESERRQSAITRIAG